jgi:CDP-diglyceride synthetase
MTSITYDWPEAVSLIFLIIGFFAAIFSGNVLILYAVCFLMGLLFGRVWYRFKRANCVPLFMTVMTFFLGFILGAIYADLRIIALLLLAGILIGYWIHEKKLIRTLEF